MNNLIGVFVAGMVGFYFGYMIGKHVELLRTLALVETTLTLVESLTRNACRRPASDAVDASHAAARQSASDAVDASHVAARRPAADAEEPHA